jgi:hypothetical protein
MRRIVADTQAADRRTWNSKPSDETSVTKAEAEAGVAAAPPKPSAMLAEQSEIEEELRRKESPSVVRSYPQVENSVGFCQASG